MPASNAEAANSSVCIVLLARAIRARMEGDEVLANGILDEIEKRSGSWLYGYFERDYKNLVEEIRVAQKKSRRRGS